MFYNMQGGEIKASAVMSGKCLMEEKYWFNWKLYTLPKVHKRADDFQKFGYKKKWREKKVKSDK